MTAFSFKIAEMLLVWINTAFTIFTIDLLCFTLKGNSEEADKWMTVFHCGFVGWYRFFRLYWCHLYCSNFYSLVSRINNIIQMYYYNIDIKAVSDN